LAKNRNSSQEFCVYPSEGRKIVRRTSRADAEIREALGLWRREYDTMTGELLGFRIVGAETNKVDSDLRSIQTSASISEGEMQMNVHCSHTYGLRERDRLELIKAGEFPEDEVERVRAKVRVYPHVGSAKGDILVAWPK